MLQEAEVSCGLTGQTRTQECPEAALQPVWAMAQSSAFIEYPLYAHRTGNTDPVPALKEAQETQGK